MSENKECFIIAPIGDEGSDTRERSNKVMEYIIEEAVSDYGYSVTRADQMDQPGSITNQVIQKTVDSELVIADLTGHNPNVFYELAVRHATGKPYIQLIQLNESIPFDISDLRTIKYGLDVDKADQAKEKIRRLLESLKNGEPEFDNPISESAEMKSLRESADPTDQNLAEVLDTMYKLDKKMDVIENKVINSGSNAIQADLETVRQHGNSGIESLNEEEKIIYSFLRDHENHYKKPVSKDDLIQKAKTRDMDEDEIEDTIQDMLMSGKIYEPADKRYKLI